MRLGFANQPLDEQFKRLVYHQSTKKSCAGLVLIVLLALSVCLFVIAASLAANAGNEPPTQLSGQDSNTSVSGIVQYDQRCSHPWLGNSVHQVFKITEHQLWNRSLKAYNKISPGAILNTSHEGKSEPVPEKPGSPQWQEYSPNDGGETVTSPMVTYVYDNKSLPNVQEAAHYGSPTASDVGTGKGVQIQESSQQNIDEQTLGTGAAWLKGQESTFAYGRASDFSYYAHGAMLVGQGANAILDPAKWAKTAVAVQQAQQQQAADASGEAGQQAFTGMMTAIAYQLPNVANENTGSSSPAAGQSDSKTMSQALWMVQTMYKKLFIPMAILLLLPGVILTQTKSLISSCLLMSTDDVDAINPFTGIMRGLLALFLIPATQLIVSYSIDVGNSMTYEVQKYLNVTQLSQWAKEQLFAPPAVNMANQLLPPQDLSENSLPAQETSDAGSGSQPQDVGKATNGSSEHSQIEQQSAMTVLMQLGYNAINALVSTGLMMLSAFQVVMMCYLFLLGPIAAAFYVWPSDSGFQGVFANWLNAVINLALWRFWWCLIVLCMQTRVQWLAQQGQFQINTQWEMIVFTAFLVMLACVPFMPWSFNPGDMVSQLMEQASQTKQGGGGASGGGGGAGGAGAGQSGNQAEPSSQSAGNSTIQSNSQTFNAVPKNTMPPPMTGKYL